jgi:hypothetical protein
MSKNHVKRCERTWGSGGELSGDGTATHYVFEPDVEEPEDAAGVEAGALGADSVLGAGALDSAGAFESPAAFDSVGAESDADWLLLLA